MATIYIDPTYHTNGAGTINDPKNTWYGLSWVAGNNYLQKRGTTFTTSVGSIGRIVPGVSGTKNARIVLGAYGEGPKPRIINLADTAINIDRRSYITVENFYIDNTQATANAIGGSGDTAAPAVDNIIRNNTVVGGEVDGLGFITATDRQGNINLLIENNLLYNIGGHGILCAGTHFNSRVVNNIVRKTGVKKDRHGISAYPHRATITPTWTLVSGNIYSTPIGAQTYLTTVTEIYGVRYTPTGITLTRATSPTTPGLNEFGFSGGLLYINIGGVPTSTITFSYTQLSVHFLDNIVEDVIDFNGIEGHGIQLDDLANNSTIKRNFVSTCEGSGIQANMGRNNIISHNVVVNCKKNGINLSVNGAVLNSAYNNTIVAGPFTLPNAVGITCGANNTAKNNVVVGYSTGVTGTATSTEDYNTLYNVTTTVSGGVTAGSNSNTINPLLNASYASKVSSNTGQFVGESVDKDGNSLNNPPLRGAYEYVNERNSR